MHDPLSSASDDPASLPPRPEDWYHTIDLGPGDVTPGLFDTRALADQIPWPDLRGKRCLDLATFDGFWAREMERRGAAEVVALDLPSFDHVDFLPRRRQHVEPHPTGAGFRHASAVLGSQVRRIEGNVYDLDPAELGTFDVVLLGALLLHLRSPVAALEAIRTVTGGHFVSIEQVEPVTSVLHRRRPLVVVRPARDWIWSVPNVAGHLAWLDLAGFDVHTTALAAMPYGPGAEELRTPERLRGFLRRQLTRRLLRVPTPRGVPVSIAVATPVAVPAQHRRARPTRDDPATG